MTDSEIITLIGERIADLADEEMNLRDQLSQTNPWDKYKIKVLAAKHNGCIDRRSELENLLDEIIDKMTKVSDERSEVMNEECNEATSDEQNECNE